MSQEVCEIKAVLIDDELNAIKNLSKLLSDYCPMVKIIAETQDGIEAIKMINDLKPDVIFLDISMPNKSGFDLLNNLEFLPFVIFVTAHDKFALKALKLSAVDFILKPVNPNDLMNAVEKIRVILTLNKTTLEHENYVDVLSVFNNHLHNSGRVKKICVPSNNATGYHVIQTADIVHLTGSDNYTIFNLITNEKIMVCKTLKEYEEVLDVFGFLRIHKSSIININHLVKIENNDELKVTMSDGFEINVSRRRGPVLLEKIKSMS